MSRAVVARGTLRRLGLAVDRWITTERCRNYSIILIVFGYGLIIFATFLGHLPHTALGETVLPDYLAHWTGGRLVLDGRLANLYDQQTQFEVQAATDGLTSKLAPGSSRRPSSGCSMHRWPASPTSSARPSGRCSRWRCC